MAVELIEKPKCGLQAVLEAPRCGFYPQGLARRCDNKAHQAVLGPTNTSFWYFPICDSCFPEFAELFPNYMQATLATQEEGPHACGNEAIFAVMVPKGGEFTYFPVANECLEAATESLPSHVLAHLYGYGEEEHS